MLDIRMRKLGYDVFKSPDDKDAVMTKDRLSASGSRALQRRV